ncbi:hypothetical protein RIF29_03687 [Crotalaria pallida]|uniref:CHORD domain-containing protein n=1 Tax=Crotalaria pallida TaxID=3830 RepID=A0AAN9J078_CROPI
MTTWLPYGILLIRFPFGMFGPGSNTGVSSSPQGPIFHDGMKEWSCCKKRSHDFSLFLQIPGGENGELRLGIRRAVRPRNGLPESVVGNQNCYPNFLSSVANAISTKSMFHVRWDENKETNHQDRVSPWEIDPSASLPQFSIQSSPRLKKLRMGQQATSPSHLFTGMHPNAEIKHTSSFLTTC